MERERREEALSPEQQNCSSGRKKNKTIQFRSDRQKKGNVLKRRRRGGLLLSPPTVILVKAELSPSFFFPMPLGGEEEG